MNRKLTVIYKKGCLRKLIKLTIALAVLLVGSVSALLINMDFSESDILYPDRTSYIIPDWIKNNAYWWSQDMISDDEFAFSLEYLIDKGVISESNCVGDCIEDEP